jgi:hypothetical protein
MECTFLEVNAAPHSPRPERKVHHGFQGSIIARSRKEEITRRSKRHKERVRITAPAGEIISEPSDQE